MRNDPFFSFGMQYGRFSFAVYVNNPLDSGMVGFFYQTYYPRGIQLNLLFVTLQFRF